MQKSMIRLFKIEDFVSLTNAVLGFLAILMTLSGEIRLAFSFILLAVIADGLDGLVARLQGNNSSVGDFLEPMADMLSFGVAPLFLTYYIYHGQVCDCFKCHFILIIIIVLFFCSTVIHLSSFYSLKSDKFFVGLPVPAAGIILSVLSYIQIDLTLILIVIAFLSFFMVSKIHFTKPNLKIGVFAVVLFFLVLLFDDFYDYLFLWLLFFAVLLFCTISPFYEKVRK